MKKIIYSIILSVMFLSLFSASDIFAAQKNKKRKRDVKETKSEIVTELDKKEAARQLLEYKDQKGNTVLHKLACSEKNLETIKALFTSEHASEFKKLINKENRLGHQPLTVALMRNAGEMAQFFLHQGALSKRGLFDIRLNGGATLLHHAVQHNNKKSVLFIIHALNDLMEQFDSTAVMDFYFNFINFRDVQGKTAFHYACELGNESLVHKLLATGFVNLECLDNNDETALHLALRRNDSVGQLIARDIIKISFFTIAAAGMVTVGSLELARNHMRTMILLPNRHGIAPAISLPSLLTELNHHVVDLRWRRLRL